MDDEKLLARLARAVETADKAWTNAHRGLPKNPMTRTAAIPAAGILFQANLWPHAVDLALVALLGAPRAAEREGDQQRQPQSSPHGQPPSQVLLHLHGSPR
mgnify:CR=1 FL=1